MSEQIPYLGQIFAILTAISWAFAVILFKKSGETVHPVALNLFKNLLAMVLLVPTIFLFGEPVRNLFDTDEYVLILLSGALGIGIADTLFFKSLNLLGAGLSAIVDCMYSPSIIILAFLWLGETLSIAQMIGIVIIISAVLTISKADNGKIITRHDLVSGIALGILAMATMAVGVVIVKPILDRSPLLWLTEVRLIGGAIILVIVLLFHPGRRRIISPRMDRRSWAYTIWGSFIGAYMAMILWLAGMKYTKASIAAALNQTANIFIFIFAALILKEPITPRRLAGIALGVSGAFIVMFG
jgi:drug/metabolite transporter (DMT)-like permease